MTYMGECLQGNICYILWGLNSRHNLVHVATGNEQLNIGTSAHAQVNKSKMEADTGDGSDLASDVSSSKIPINTAVESSGPEDDEHDDDELPSVQFVESVYFKRLIQISIVVSAISVGMNSTHNCGMSL